MRAVRAESGHGSGRCVFPRRTHWFRITAEIWFDLSDAEGGTPSGQPALPRTVILSAAGASRSEAPAESKDPYLLNFRRRTLLFPFQLRRQLTPPRDNGNMVSFDYVNPSASEWAAFAQDDNS
jgi:hypothetical protein